MNDVAIRVDGLGKRYRIGAQRKSYRTLRETITDLAAAPARALQRHVRRSNDQRAADSFWALKDVSFEVKRGEVLGIIGRNGAGKSTLLKILSRITEPTEGAADIYGRVGSLLEVGTGFHPELTGRENIHLNGAILGMRRAEIERKFDEIVAFAEVEKFIDTPVKHYSSGMYLRLAFSVAAHLEPEILLVDEVLAVGDAEFQKKCLGKMSDVSRQGRTVLFVSHNMSAVSQLCGKALLVERGRLACCDSANVVIDRYLREASASTLSTADLSDWPHRSGVGRGRIVAVTIEDREGTPATTIGVGEPFRICIFADLTDELPSLVAGVELRSASGMPLLNLRSDSQGLFFGPYPAGSRVAIEVRIPGLPFYPGTYHLEPWIGAKRGKRIDHVHGAMAIRLECTGVYKSEMLLQPGRGMVIVDCDWYAGQLLGTNCSRRDGEHALWAPGGTRG